MSEVKVYIFMKCFQTLPQMAGVKGQQRRQKKLLIRLLDTKIKLSTFSRDDDDDDDDGDDDAGGDDAYYDVGDSYKMITLVMMLMTTTTTMMMVVMMMMMVMMKIMMTAVVENYFVDIGRLRNPLWRERAIENLSSES